MRGGTAGHQVGGDHHRRRLLTASRRRRREEQRQRPQPQPRPQDRPDLPRSSSEPATKLGAHAATARWWDSDHLSASLPPSFGRKDENSAGSLVAVQVENDDTKAAATKPRPRCGPRRGCYGHRYRFCAVTTLSAAVVLGTLLLAGPGRGGGLSVTDAAAAASDPVAAERRERSLDSNPGIAAPLDLDADNEPDAQILEEDTASDTDNEPGSQMILEEDTASGADNATDAQILEEDTGTSGADNETDAQILEDNAASGVGNELEEDTSDETGSNALEGDRKNYDHLRRKPMFIDEKAKQKMLEEKMKVNSLMDDEDEVT